MPKRIDGPCPICGRPCSTWAISDDPNEDMILCWEGDYKVRGLENHRRLSRLVRAAEEWARLLPHGPSGEYVKAVDALFEAVEGGRRDG